MRLCLAFLLILLSPILSAESALLILSVKQQKIEVPFWASKKTTKGGIVIVVGGNESQLVLQQLGEKMTTFGWSVILLRSDKQLPWLEQLPEALSALRQKNNKRIVVIHYGDQLQQLLDYFNKPQSKQVNGLILLSAYDLSSLETKETAAQRLKKPLRLRFSVLDIVGQFDYPAVIQQYTQRTALFPPQKYQQYILPGAAHDYGYQQMMLAAFIHGKINRLIVPKLSRPPISIK